MSALTAATVRHGFLEPALDARALNDAQQRLIQNDTPEVDSVTEHLTLIGRHLRGTDATPDLVHLFDRVLELRDSNVAEGGLERTICGRADRLVTDLRTLELSGSGGPSPLAARSLARRLREPLRVIAEPPLGDPRALVDAGRKVGEVIAHIPAEQLFTRDVTRELGERRAATLRALYERRATNEGATAEGDRGAKDSREDARGLTEL